MFRSLISLSIFLLTITTSVASGIAADSSEQETTQEIKQNYKVLFLPLDATQAAEYAPLVPGISNMLASELANRDRITAIDYDLKKKELAELGSAGKSVTTTDLAVDYIIRGSVYKIGEGMSMQVKVLATDTAINTQNFSVKAESEQEIFAVVDDMAAQLTTGVFGYDKTDNVDQALAMGLSGFTTSHPDKEYKKGLMGSGGFYGDSALNTIADVKVMRKTPNLPDDIVSIVSSDLDGDGTIESIYASRTNLFFFQEQEQVISQIGSYEFSSKVKINAINVADLNGDGKQEIYVSANYGGKARSEVLSWTKNGGVKKELTISNWFVAPMYVPGKGTVLLGQRGTDDRAKSFLLSGVYELKSLGNGKLQKGERISLPENVNLLSFLWADVTGSGTDELLVLDKRERLLIYNGNNELVHVSRDNFGGSTNFFGVGLGKNNNGFGKGQDEEMNDFGNWNYIPTRLIAKDIDDDGKAEIIVGSNRRSELVVSAREKQKAEEAKKEGRTMLNSFFDLFPNSRSYEGGSVACLSYDGSVLQEKWRTNAITGYLADYSYSTSVELDKDGKGKEIVHLSMAQVQEGSLLDFFSAKESKVQVYEFSYKDLSDSE